MRNFASSILSISEHKCFSSLADSRTSSWPYSSLRTDYCSRSWLSGVNVELIDMSGVICRVDRYDLDNLPKLRLNDSSSSVTMAYICLEGKNSWEFLTQRGLPAVLCLLKVVGKGPRLAQNTLESPKTSTLFTIIRCRNGDRVRDDLGKEGLFILFVSLNFRRHLSTAFDQLARILKVFHIWITDAYPEVRQNSDYF